MPTAAPQNDFTRMGSHYFKKPEYFGVAGTRVPPNIAEIGALGKSIDAARFTVRGRAANLQVFCRELLKLHLPKGGTQTSNWRTPTLSKEQQQYAALDAVVHLRTYTELLKLQRKNCVGPPQKGDACALLNYNCRDMVAQGTVVEVDGDWVKVEVLESDVVSDASMLPDQGDGGRRQSFRTLMRAVLQSLYTVRWRRANLQVLRRAADMVRYAYSRAPTLTTLHHNSALTWRRVM